MVFVIHWHESAMDLHVFPIPTPSHLPLYPIPLGLPSAPGPSTCLMYPASCQAILRLPVSLVSYLSKNSVLFHVYTSQSVCNISTFLNIWKPSRNFLISPPSNQQTVYNDISFQVFLCIYNRSCLLLPTREPYLPESSGFQHLCS